MKTKKVFLTIMMLFCVFIIEAQDKYEFMTIIYIPVALEITTSINGSQLLKENVTKENYEKTDENANPLLKKINEYQDQDWEIMTINIISNGRTSYSAVLKKKK